MAAVQARVTVRHVPRNALLQAYATPTPGPDPANLPKYKSTWEHTHTNTSPPTLTLPAACTPRQTTFSIASGPQKTMVPEKIQKCGNTGSLCLDKPVFGHGGTSGGMTVATQTRMLRQMV